MITVRNMLLNGQYGQRSAAEGAGTYYFPIMRTNAAVETVYAVTIERLVGAPSSARLQLFFQSVQSTSQGIDSSNNVTDLKPLPFTLNADDHRDLLPDGDWPTTVADQTMTTTVGASSIHLIRRIKGGFQHRLGFTQSFTGGTTPAFVMTIEQQVRY